MSLPNSDQHRVKHEFPCTAAENPAYYAYLLQHIGETNIQKRLRQEAEALERPGMMASPDEYQFLAWLAATMNAKRVIEVGVFRGVTTLALALQLAEDATIKALDIEESYCELGKKAWQEAGVAHKIELMIGPAADSMRALLDERHEAGTYDFIFIDADKSGYMEYYELALKLVRIGGVIAVDNTLFHGRALGSVLEAGHADLANLPEQEQYDMPVRQLNQLLQRDTRVSAVMNILADGVYLVRRVV